MVTGKDAVTLFISGKIALTLKLVSEDPVGGIGGGTGGTGRALDKNGAA